MKTDSIDIRPTHSSKMDKHQRKQLAKWEAKKAKGQDKFMEKVRESFRDPALDKVEAFARSYTPPTWVLCGIIGQVKEFLEEVRTPSPSDYWVSFANWTLMDDDFRSRMYTIESSRVARFRGVEYIPYHSDYERFFIYDEHSLERRIDIAKTINAIREHKKRTAKKDYAQGIMRSARRLDIFGAEFLSVYPRWRAVLNCKAVKEELMAAAWHPRRVDHILETYGWEAYDNLLGVE